MMLGGVSDGAFTDPPRNREHRSPVSFGLWQKCVNVILPQKLGRICASLQLQPCFFLHPETPTEAPPCGFWPLDLLCFCFLLVLDGFSGFSSEKSTFLPLRRGQELAALVWEEGEMWRPALGLLFDISFFSSFLLPSWLFDCLWSSFWT